MVNIYLDARTYWNLGNYLPRVLFALGIKKQSNQKVNIFALNNLYNKYGVDKAVLSLGVKEIPLYFNLFIKIKAAFFAVWAIVRHLDQDAIARIKYK